MDKANITNPVSMFDLLDSKLKERDIVIDLVICGGLLLQMIYKSTRDTHDIDTITALDEYVKEVIAEVGSDMIGDGFANSKNWLNDDAVRTFYFDRILPKGWEDRAFDEPPIFEGEYLRIYPLSRSDMILTKLFGFFTRDSASRAKDIKDLMFMGASKDEIKMAIPNLFNMLKNTHWQRSEEELAKILFENWQ